MVHLVGGIILLFVVILWIFVLRRSNWRRWTLPVTAIFICPLLTSLLVNWVIEMEHIRNEMKAIIGAGSQDEQWGFGQIIAVFLWLPLCGKILLYVVDRA